ncbi:hypothetical protein BYT27DRAFT_7185057 [Phlegmacium glaucopus]|nr:hypothetical protein BYT27DRAFT_7185057 [Phlegmacium glaucopus]
MISLVGGRYDFTERTNFSRQQTHQDFKPIDAFQHVSDKKPEKRKEKKNSADNKDELEGVDADEGEDEEDEDGGPDGCKYSSDTNVVLVLDEPREEEYIISDEAKIPRPSASSSVETDTESGIHMWADCYLEGLGSSTSFRKH